MTDHHIAHLNVAKMKAPMVDPVMAGFVAMLDPVHAEASAHPGFVWRLEESMRDPDPARRPFAPDILINISVWRSVADLRDYTYQGDHLKVMRSRTRWFTPEGPRNMVLWTIPVGHKPTEAEAAERLRLLVEQGPTAEAFTFATGPD